jgi:hypothetical protein
MTMNASQAARAREAQKLKRRGYRRGDIVWLRPIETQPREVCEIVAVQKNGMYTGQILGELLHSDDGLREFLDDEIEGHVVIPCKSKRITAAESRRFIKRYQGRTVAYLRKTASNRELEIFRAFWAEAKLMGTKIVRAA